MTQKYLIQKEFLQIRRNSFMPKIIFIFPIMVMCVMPWVMNQEVKNIRVDVVDINRTTASQQLVHQIEASNYFIFNGQKATYQDALKDVETSKADIILEIRGGKFLIAANAVNGITCQGSLWLIYLLAILLALFFSSLGLIVSNYSDTLQQAMLVMWFFVVCLMLLSGLFTPTRSMPDWANLTTYVNPMHYFVDAIRTVFVRGGNFSSIAHQVFALVAIASVMAFWAVKSYKKNS